ncbi:XRE family transcriptional regulator [Streptomyces sp. NPDC093707]|uniref:XRE family transcriptional regulator n=1 Tax=Streptomyces sp. NPDC093707 TaxID=3154984 RepID=UPI00344BC5A0
MGELGIGELLVRLRRGRGSVTQAQIAADFNAVEGSAVPRLTGKEIGRYEREQRLPNSRTRGILAQVFGVDRALLDRAHAVSRRRQGEECLPAVPAPESAAVTARDVPSFPSPPVLAADAVDSAKFARFLASRNVTATTVEQLDADAARLACMFVSHPWGELYGEIRYLRNETFDLLRGRQRPRQTSDLLVTASKLCGLSAHVCLDTGDYESAATHARAAWSCAEAAGHNEMRAWVRSVESLIAFWNGKPQQAADLARQGRSHMACGTVGVRLASLEARALAVAGNAHEATAALATAQRARDAVRVPDDMPGIFDFPIAKQLTYAGTTHLAIGGARNVRKAIECAESAVGRYREAMAADQSTFDLLAAHLDLVRGHMLAGDLEGAETVLDTVLNSGPEQLSASIHHRLGALARELGTAQYRGAPRIAQLRERIMTAASPSALPAADRPEPLT